MPLSKSHDAEVSRAASDVIRGTKAHNCSDVARQDVKPSRQRGSHSL